MRKYARPIIVGFIVAFVVSALVSLPAMAAGAPVGNTPALVGMTFGVLTAFIMANMVGTRKGVAGRAEDKAAAVAFTPAPGKAMLIVVREGFVGMATGLNISVDGRMVAQLKSPRFTAIALDVGQHEMELGFGGLAAKQNQPNVERFGIGVGEVVAYRATLSIGMQKNTIALERVAADAALSAKLRAMTMTAVDA